MWIEVEGENKRGVDGEKSCVDKDLVIKQVVNYILVSFSRFVLRL